MTRARLACGFSMSHPGQNRESVPLGRDLYHQTRPPSGVLASGFHIRISGCSGGRGNHPACDSSMWLFSPGTVFLLEVHQFALALHQPCSGRSLNSLLCKRFGRGLTVDSQDEERRSI